MKRKRAKKSILPVYVEISGNADVLRLERVLYDAGYCFIEGKRTRESLYRCEMRLIKEGLVIDFRK